MLRLLGSTFVLMFLFVLAAFAQAQDAALIAVAATASGDGVLTVPVGGIAAFAFAVMNYGDTATFASASATPVQVVNNTTSPLPGVSVVEVCFTNPTTGQCLVSDPTSPSINVFTLMPGEVATGTVYVAATTAVPFSPGTTRVVVSFGEAERLHPGVPGFPFVFVPGATYAATSVALEAR